VALIIEIFVSLLVGLFGIENIGLPPCAAEDSDNCYWLASERGNGEGTSFVTVFGQTVLFDI
jgi:hypothetical protein